METERQYNRTLATVARHGEQRYPSSLTNFVCLLNFPSTHARESVDRIAALVTLGGRAQIVLHSGAGNDTSIAY